MSTLRIWRRPGPDADFAPISHKTEIEAVLCYSEAPACTMVDSKGVIVLQHAVSEMR